MRLFRADKSVSADKFESASEYYADVRAGLREKSNHNKCEAQAAFSLVVGSTLVAPLFVTLGTGDFWGKAVPAGLSVLAAALTTWLQLRKPQRLWSIYRRGQRELEREKAGYDFRFGDYEQATDRDKLLAARVSAIAFRVHEQWEGLVPEPENLGAAKPPGALEVNDQQETR